MIAEAGLAGLQLAGGYFASQNMRDSAKLNQDIANMNAQFAELDAYDAVTQGETEKTRYQEVIDKTLGQQQLNMSAADIDTKYGTASSFQQETKFTGELNLMQIQKQAQEKALGYKTQAMQFTTSGVLQRAEGDAKASAVMFNAEMGAAKTGVDAWGNSGFAGLTGYKREGIKNKKYIE